MVLRFLARVFFLCRFIQHDWKYAPGNVFKRTCETCGRHEWGFSRPYPSIDCPTIKWRRMYGKD